MGAKYKRLSWRLRNITIGHVVGVCFIIITILIYLAGGFAHAGVTSAVSAVKSVGGKVLPTKPTDSLYALYTNGTLPMLALFDTTTGGEVYGYIRITADSIWQFSSDSGGTWSNFNAGASRSDIGDTANVLRGEMAAGGGGDVTGLDLVSTDTATVIQASGISSSNPDGPGEIIMGLNWPKIRQVIDTLNQVKIPNSDSTTYAKGVRHGTYTAPTGEGQFLWQSTNEELRIGTGAGYKTLKQVPDSAAKAGSFDPSALEAMAVAQGASNGQVPVYRYASDSIIWEDQSGVSDIYVYSGSVTPGGPTTNPLTRLYIPSTSGIRYYEDLVNTGYYQLDIDYAYNKIQLGAGDDIAGALTVDHGGTGKTSLTTYTIPYGQGGSAFGEVGPLSNGGLVIGQNGGPPLSGTITGSLGIDVTLGAGSIDIGRNFSGSNRVSLTSEVQNTLPVGNGGTGVTSIDGNEIVTGNGTSAIATIDLNVDGMLLIGSDTGGLAQGYITAGAGIQINNGEGTIQVVNAHGTNIDSTDILDEGLSLTDLNDHDAEDGQVITWSSSNDTWEPATPSADILAEPGDTSIAYVPITGDSFLVVIDTANDTATMRFTGTLVFGDGDTNYFVSPTVLLGSSWPADSGTNGYQLTTDGAGALSWAAAGGAGSGSEDSVYFNDGSTEYKSLNNLVKVKEGHAIDLVREDSTTYDVIKINVDTADAVADSEKKPVTGNAVYDFCETTQGYLTSPIADGDVPNDITIGDLATDSASWNAVADFYDGNIFNPDSITANIVRTDTVVMDGDTITAIVETESDPTLTDDDGITIGDGAGKPIITFNGDAGTDGTIGWNYTQDGFELNGQVLFVGGAAADVDPVLQMKGEDNEGELKYWEDEDVFTIVEPLYRNTISTDSLLATAKLVDIKLDSAATANEWAPDSDFVKLNADTLDADSANIIDLSVNGVNFTDTVQALAGAEADSEYVKITADSAHIGIINSDTTNAAMLVCDTIVVNDEVTLPNASITSAMLGGSAVTTSKIADQEVKQEDIDSTDENFAFDGAYHVTTAEADSAYATLGATEAAIGDSMDNFTIDNFPLIRGGMRHSGQNLIANLRYEFDSASIYCEPADTPMWDWSRLLNASLISPCNDSTDGYDARGGMHMTTQGIPWFVGPRPGDTVIDWRFIGTPVYQNTGGLDDMETSGSYDSTYGDACHFQVEITSTGTPDVFRWRVNDSVWVTGVNCSTGDIELIAGAHITFGATTGHSADDKWSFYGYEFNAKITSTIYSNDGGVDDMATGGEYDSTYTDSAYWEVEIDGVLLTNTFQWRVNGGSWTTSVNCDTDSITLAAGVKIVFGAAGGHDIDDRWEFYTYDRVHTAKSNTPLYNFILGGTADDTCSGFIVELPCVLYSRDNGETYERGFYVDSASGDTFYIPQPIFNVDSVSYQVGDTLHAAGETSDICLGLDYDGSVIAATRVKYADSVIGGAKTYTYSLVANRSTDGLVWYKYGEAIHGESFQRIIALDGSTNYLISPSISVSYTHLTLPTN